MHVCRIDTPARTTNRICAAAHAGTSSERVGPGATARIEVDARTQFTRCEEHRRSVRSERASGLVARPRATQIGTTGLIRAS